eukprot:gnl/TRDRNA2_/TRDRNA2_193516_c0_seq1.p1 gnl/TRDRNA2_/TRDRNA2_193516_c0~~gnl/TRDRNA2_/TRDRNA2_193516_c0_seq1.p1  ORF type:complete len:166 (+),score=43.63 gnl/TRDRNA2_/TRDRNA2_193516_c0_seq1:176-673(+)
MSAAQPQHGDSTDEGGVLCAVAELETARRSLRALAQRLRHGDAVSNASAEMEIEVRQLRMELQEARSAERKARASGREEARELREEVREVQAELILERAEVPKLRSELATLEARRASVEAEKDELIRSLTGQLAAIHSSWAADVEGLHERYLTQFVVAPRSPRGG